MESQRQVGQHFLNVSPISNQDQLLKLKHAAIEDDHVTLFPTHIVQRSDEIVGYLSVCSTPIVNVWMHSKKITASDSLRILNFTENLARCQGHSVIVMPCAENSPYYPHMEKLGFSRFGFTSINVKSI